MLYEAMLTRLKKRRALSKKGSDGVTALEVLSDFTSLGNLAFVVLLSTDTTYIFHYFVSCLLHPQTKIALCH